MLKALYKVRENLTFEFESKEQPDIFEQLASCQEVFGIQHCELCKKGDLKFQVRKVDKSKFFELVCKTPGCGGKLALSVHQDGDTLYPISKLKNGVPAKVADEGPFDWSTKGWHKYDKDKAVANKKVEDTKKTNSKR